MSVLKSTNRLKQIKHATDLFHNRKTLGQMLGEVVKGKYKMSFLTSMIILFGCLYIFLPFDFDWIPFIGWIDDGFVGYFVIKRLLKETQRFNRFKAMERKIS